MTTEQRWAPAPGRARPVGLEHGGDLDEVEETDEVEEPDDDDGGERHPGRARWGVPPRAALALAVVALVVAAVLVVRATVLQPEAVVQQAIDPSVAAVPAAADGGAAPEPAEAPSTSTPGTTPSTTPTGSSAASASQGPVAVHVVGAVVAPGVVEVPAGSRVADAVAAAGGLSPEADPAGVNLARAIGDGEQVVVPRPGEVAVPAAPPPGGPAAPGAPGAAPGAPAAPGQPAEPVDVNAAGVAELDALPGIGPVLAQRIVGFREANGPFTSVDELVEVPGIGDATLADLTPLVRV